MKLTLKKETVRALAVKTAVHAGTGSVVICAIEGGLQPPPTPSGHGLNCIVGHASGLASQPPDLCHPNPIGNSIYQNGP